MHKNPGKLSLKHKIVLILTKMGLLKSHDFSGKYTKRLHQIEFGALTLIVIVGLTSFIVGGYFRNEALVNDVSELSAELEMRNNEIENLFTSIEESDEELFNKQREVGEKEREIVKLHGNIDTLEQQSGSLGADLILTQNLYENTQSQLSICLDDEFIYKETVRNSVRFVCCSFGDVEAGVTKNWQIENNKVVCNGNLKVNCGTGVSDNPG